MKTMIKCLRYLALPSEAKNWVCDFLQTYPICAAQDSGRLALDATRHLSLPTFVCHLEA